ncbi:hypothetical protein [Thalassobacillus hwangdonensis]|uniref:Uncharacterized protein n=1 Tax=Thalassobacillus hwangdonensis TaxID=546108 RepID=A0ABW3L1D3_9BACI
MQDLLGNWMEYFWLLGLICIIILLLQRTSFSKRMKGIVIGYFLLVTVVFASVREWIRAKFGGTPVPEEYWDKNSAWVDVAAWLYLLPLAVVVFIAYLRWFEKAKTTQKKVWIGVSILPMLLFFVFYLFVFGFMYGYRP